MLLIGEKLSMADEKIVVHVTHEATEKIGGIGAVLEGLFTCKAYLEAVKRSIITGPLFSYNGSAQSRLGEHAEVLYWSAENICNTPYSGAFRRIEKIYNTQILYGTRTFTDSRTGTQSSPEVLLIDVRHINPDIVNEFKRRMFHHFGIHSDLYEHIWEYEQYVRLAPAAIAAIKTLCSADQSTTIIAHEFMGMPTALAAGMETEWNFKTIFYAHEVATIRKIVETHPGHDTMFYNVMKYCRKNKLNINEVFGDQSCYFKHPLVEASRHCHHIFAVGNHTADEMRFLAPEFENADINIVYNGIPSYAISAEEKIKSKGKLQKYCENLLGFKPDYIFSHVTRMVKSKGLWRDLQVLERIEKEFRAQNKTGVMFLLSTETAARPNRDILKMESSYNWPVAHREGWPDLSGGEADFYPVIQAFNAKSRNIKVIFINQFGFDKQSCGTRMPEDMEFMDIRKGNDVEFGMSVYEPFGISQLEPLTFGGICVISSVCGCAGFVQAVGEPHKIPNVIIADYTTSVNGSIDDIQELINADGFMRRQIEHQTSEKLAREIIERLPENKNELDNMIRSGYNLAVNMSWESVVRKFLLPNLQKKSAQKGVRQPAQTHS